MNLNLSSQIRFVRKTILTVIQTWNDLKVFLYLQIKFQIKKS